MITIWHFATGVLLCLIAAPLVAIFASFAAFDEALWRHLASYVLPEALSTTFALLAGVAGLTLLLGVGFAWLTTAYRFPGRDFFRIALVLPLAFPSYILTYIYLAWFEVPSPVGLWLMRQGLSLTPRSLAGAVLILSLALYPYVFLAARLAFATLAQRAFEVGQSLGLDRSACFWRIALPLARPFLVGGVTLVAFETLADFGAVSLLGVNTLSVAIFKAWYSLFSLSTALQIAAILVLAAIALLIGEALVRRKERFISEAISDDIAQPLKGVRAWFAFAACALFWGIAFVAPLLQLLIWISAEALPSSSWQRFWQAGANSLLLGGTGAFCTVAAALVLAYAKRLLPTPWMTAAVQFAKAGYAFPGAVLAVGMIAAIGFVDKILLPLFSWTLSGTLLVMLLAYAARFLAVAHGPVAAALERITPSMDEAAQSLGLRPGAVLITVHLPLMRPAILGAAAFVFIDILKELPITLMTRPFGWETLATRIFELTNDSRWQEAALPALTLVVAGIIPALFFALQNHRTRLRLKCPG